MFVGAEVETENRRDQALHINGVSHSFKGKGRIRVPVLDDLNITVAPEEFVVILGPSGCGKSTLLNILAGFQMPESGHVSFGGLPVTGPGPERGVVFQSPTLMPWLTIWQNVTFGPKLRGTMAKSEATARGLLAEVGLSDYSDHLPWQLSGGMRARASLARALANDPEVLLMDEPFAALDAHTRSSMQSLLLTLSAQHRRSVVFITHDIDEAILLADRVVVLSARPAHIRAEFLIEFPRPREYELTDTAEFRRLRKQLRELTWS